MKPKAGHDHHFRLNYLSAWFLFICGLFYTLSVSGYLASKGIGNVIPS